MSITALRHDFATNELSHTNYLMTLDIVNIFVTLSLGISGLCCDSLVYCIRYRRSHNCQFGEFVLTKLMVPRYCYFCSLNISLFQGNFQNKNKFNMMNELLAEMPDYVPHINFYSFWITSRFFDVIVCENLVCPDRRRFSPVSTQIQNRVLS